MRVASCVVPLPGPQDLQWACSAGNRAATRDGLEVKTRCGSVLSVLEALRSEETHTVSPGPADNGVPAVENVIRDRRCYMQAAFRLAGVDVYVAVMYFESAKLRQRIRFEAPLHTPTNCARTAKLCHDLNLRVLKFSVGVNVRTGLT